MTTAFATRSLGLVSMLALALLAAPAPVACPDRKALAPRPPLAQGRRRFPADGGQARLCRREGLKLELLEVKDDQIGLKALLAGELDSYEGGVQGADRGRRARRRRQDHRLPLAGGAARHHGEEHRRQNGGPQGQGHRGVLARLVPRHAGARLARQVQARPLRCEARRRRRRPRPLHRARSAAWSMRRWCRTNMCRCRPRRT